MDIVEKKFFRHIQIGPGIKTEQNGDSINIKFIKPDGTFEDRIYTYKVSDWKIKEIPEDSFGAVFVLDSNKIFNLLENHDPKLVELYLAELKGRASLDEIKNGFEPILNAKGYAWSKWWKKIAPKLKSLNTVSYVKNERIYRRVDPDMRLDSSINLTEEKIRLLSPGELLKVFQSLIHNPKKLQEEQQEEVISTLWKRVIEMFGRTSPRETSSTILLAISYILSEVSTPNNERETKIQNWLERENVNLLGIRDFTIRNYSLQFLSRIDWSGKINSFATYVINEESSEQNRSTALRILWNLFNNDIPGYVDSLLLAIKEMKMVDKSPSTFLPARTGRIVQCNLQFLPMIKKKNDLLVFLGGINKVMLALFKKHYIPPLDTEPGLAILNIWLSFFEKGIDLIPNDINWMMWTSFEPIFKQCSIHCRLKFFHESGIAIKWADQIPSHLINLADSDDQNNADILYNILEMLVTEEKAFRLIDLAFKNHQFKTKQGQEWAISKTLKMSNIKEPYNQEASEIFQGILGRPQIQNKGQIDKDVSRLILLYHERKIEVLNSIEILEKLVRLYEPVNLEQIEFLKSFYTLLDDQIIKLITVLQVDFIGPVGEVQPYDSNRHHIIKENDIPFLYVEIVRIGIGRWVNESQYEVVEKAIAKPIVGEKL